VLTRVAGSYIAEVSLPGVVPTLGAIAVLVVAALLASLVPAVRAARVDVIDALRPE
jgi:ABC-type lipoprotein release transport system permease subunit